MTTSENTVELSELVTRLTNTQEMLKTLQNEIQDISLKILAIVNAGQNSSFSTTNNSSSLTTNKRSASTDASDTGYLSVDKSKKFKRDFKPNFTIENDYVVVYTDGACVNNGKTNAKAGIGVWFGDNHPLNVSEPVQGKPTNNVAEIQACISAVNTVLEYGVSKLKIKTDSQFVINSMTQWIHRWKRNNWKVTDGSQVKNKEDFVVLDNCLKKLTDVKWEHINGHSGIIGNEEADRLARLGAVLYKKNK